MNFDLGQLTTIPSVLVGAAIASAVWFFLDKKFAGKGNSGVTNSDYEKVISQLQTDLDATQENQAKVNEVHAYARQLEEKIQQLESVSDTADSELRVKVLEKQLSEKADLESRLAIALQQLEDYKAKAEMYDTVMGASPKPAAPTTPELTAPVEPVAELESAAEELEAEPEVVEPVVAEEVVVAEEPEEVFEEVVAETVVSTPAELTAPAAEKQEAEEEEPLVAVASADSGPEIKLVENQVAKTSVSPAGATAPALDDRPALRVESSLEPILEVKDPLEKIDGIGQIYQSKLYEAGIKTFAQLAASSPSRITEIIEPQNWQQIDVMKWRREAALFASGEKD